MNVAQLIEQLQNLPQDCMVVCRGYEGGVNEVMDVNSVNLKLNVHSAWYYGAHEIEENGNTPGVFIG